MKTEIKCRRAAKHLMALVFAGFGLALTAVAAPVVSNVRLTQEAGNGLVDIYYDLASASNVLTVSLAISTNSGVSFDVTAKTLSGDVGGGVTPGTGKHVVWGAAADLPAQYFPNMKVRVSADDGSILPPPAILTLISGGSFTMGDSLDSDSAALPLHVVQISAFQLESYDVTLALWTDVYQWATNHGYIFDGQEAGKGTNYPVEMVDWYDCVKWCNARSQMENRKPAYYTDATQQTVYQTGTLDLSNACVNWNSGYRLPTESEWEMAARAGLTGQRFPWGLTISESQANYFSSTNVSYDLSNTGFNPAYETGASPYTSPVGAFAPNGFGLYDMAGNVWQWCWDWYGNYGDTPKLTRVAHQQGFTVCRGAVVGSTERSIAGRRIRNWVRPGKSWASLYVGFRCVLPAGQ